MTTYNTGNPVGSAAPKDLYDNAENLDTALHTGENTWVDRFGNTRTSWAGATGYQVLGDYAGGIEITERNQIVREGGEYWRLKGSVDIPYTTTGTWVGDDDARFVSVGDAVLRSELALDGGVFLVKDAVASVANVTELRALTGLVDGSVVLTQGYYAPGDGGGNAYLIVAGGTGTDNGGSYIDLHASGLQAKGLFLDGCYRVAQFGCQDDDVVDQTDEFQAFLDSVPSGARAYGQGFSIYLTADVSRTASIDFDGQGMVIKTDYEVDLSGSASEVASVSSAVSIGDRSISVTDASAVSQGDVVALLDDRLESLNGFRSYYKAGEFAVVESVSGNTLYLSSGVLTAYPATIDSKVFLFDGTLFSVKNLSVVPNSVSVSSRKLGIKNATSVSLNGVRVIGGTSAALSIRESYDVRGSRLFCRNYAAAAGTQYGAVISNSQNVEISGDFFGTRHGAATGGESSIAVPVRDCWVVYSSVASTDSHAADLHGNSIDCGYKNCRIAGAAFIGGKNPSLIDCDVDGVVRASEFYAGKLLVQGGSVNVSTATTACSWGTSVQVANISEDFSIELNGVKINGASVTALMVASTTPFGIKGAYKLKDIEYEEATSGALITLADFSDDPADSIEISGVDPSVTTLTAWAAGTASVVGASTELISPPQSISMTISYAAGASWSNANAAHLYFGDGSRRPAVSVSSSVASENSIIASRGSTGTNTFIAMVSMSGSGFSAAGTHDVVASVRYSGRD